MEQKMIFHKPRMLIKNQEIQEVLERCFVVHVALQNGKIPYVVPMNYGYVMEEEHPVLYLHSQKNGKKINCIKANPDVGFALDWFSEKESLRAHCDMHYQSIIGEGRLSIVEDEEECVRGMNSILLHAKKRPIKKYTEQFFAHFHVLRLDVDVFSGKEL